MNIVKKYLDIDYSEEVIEEVEIEIKYEGYIVKALKEAEKLNNLENKNT